MMGPIQAADVFQFHCGTCSELLAVPPRAIGTLVRCPSCQQTITVPESDAEFEESVSNWIAEDVAELWDEEDEVVERKVVAHAPPEPPPEVRPEVPPAVPPSLSARMMQREPALAPVAGPRSRSHARVIRLFI